MGAKWVGPSENGAAMRKRPRRSRGGVGFVLTLRNTSVLFATGLAAAIGEHPRRAQVAGAVLVAAGAILMAW
jgi:drug/metabolite transporter (DMT)-like permease